jgi:hypothetical protein
MDPVSFILGVLMGAVVCRCVFFYWKENYDKKVGVKQE